MKKYVKPILRTEEFVPQEYCKYCGTITRYKFKCDAGGGVYGDVFLDDGTNLTKNKFEYDDGEYKEKTVRFHACNKKHKAYSTDEFLHGYYLANGGNDETVGYTQIPVIIWRGEKGDNVHATTQLDMNQWETAKS